MSRKTRSREPLNVKARLNKCLASIHRLLCEVFLPENVPVSAQGNMLAAMYFIHGLAVEDLNPEELNYYDQDNQVVITARAVKGDK